MIKVTKSFLPSKEEYQRYLDHVWETNWLTNDGQLLKDLKNRLEQYLQVKNLDMLNNGTIALQLAIKALELKGEIITTPFSYVATTSSIVWEGCKPVFCDIDPNTCNVDVNLIEEKITSKTTALLFTHVYGNPCDVTEIEEIAKKHNLKVIYDAAHCFGVSLNGKSIFSYGDISTTSFHATKIFHTVEGGATISASEELSYKIRQLRNFGHKGFEDFDGLGINGKQSEFHAAMGHCVLDHFQEILKGRADAYRYYVDQLNWEHISRPKFHPLATNNHSYFPIILQSEAKTIELKSKLEEHDIYPRRYFYPSLTKLPYVSVPSAMKYSEDISKRVLCLPLYHDLNAPVQDKIITLINLYLKL